MGLSWNELPRVGLPGPGPPSANRASTVAAACTAFWFCRSLRPWRAANWWAGVRMAFRMAPLPSGMVALLKIVPKNQGFWRDRLSR